MKLYSVKNGKYCFKGDKRQIATYQYITISISLILAIIFSSWWFIAGAIIIFFSFYNVIQLETISDSIRIYFFPNCIYDPCYNQINNLYGFSEGFYKWNSASIGWRCIDDNKIELLACCYINKKNVIKSLLKCKPESWVFCNIQNKKSKYVFKALTPNNESVTVSINKDKKFSYYDLFSLFMYRLYPHFGGKIPAPNDMDLYLIKIETD